MSNLELERDSTLRDDAVDAADENAEIIIPDLHDPPLPINSTIEICCTSASASISTSTPTSTPADSFQVINKDHSISPSSSSELSKELVQPLPNLEKEREIELEFEEFFKAHNSEKVKKNIEVIDLESQSQLPSTSSFIPQITDLTRHPSSCSDVEIIEIIEPISSQPSTSNQNDGMKNPTNKTVQNLETDTLTLPILTNSDLNLHLQDNRKDKPTFQQQPSVEPDIDIIEIREPRPPPPVIIQQPPSIQRREESEKALDTFERDLFGSSLSLEFREFDETIRRIQSNSLALNLTKSNANPVTADTSNDYSLNLQPLNLNIDDNNTRLGEDRRERVNSLFQFDNLTNMDQRSKAIIDFESALAQRLRLASTPLSGTVQPGPSTSTSASTGQVPMGPQNNIEVDNSNNDCVHFFKPAGCLMDDDCSFRHSEAALGCYTECDQWKLTNGQCDEWVLCSKRHMKQEDIISHKRKYHDARSETELASSFKKTKPAEATTTTPTTAAAAYIPPQTNPTVPFFSSTPMLNPIISASVINSTGNISNPIQYSVQPTSKFALPSQSHHASIAAAAQAHALSAARLAAYSTNRKFRVTNKNTPATTVLSGLPTPTPAQVLPTPTVTQRPRASKTEKIIIPSKYKNPVSAPGPNTKLIQNLADQIPATQNPAISSFQAKVSTTASSTVTSASGSSTTAGILPPNTTATALSISTTPSLGVIPNSELVVPPPLSANVPQNPPTAVEKNNNSSNKALECPICLEDFEAIKAKNFTLMFIQCGHIVCSDCCVAITKKKPLKLNNCPVCRKPITQKPKPCFF